MFILGPDKYVIHDILEKVVELKSEDDGSIRRFAYNKLNEKFLKDILNYQHAAKEGYIEHKKLLYMFIEIIMERLIEI